MPCPLRSAIDSEGMVRVIHDDAWSLWLVTLACALLLIVGCGTRISDDFIALSQSPILEPMEQRLGVGDSFEIRVFREQELSGQFVVSERGSINYPFVGRLVVSGMTCSEIEDEITRALGDGRIHEPVVNCLIVEQRSLRVLVVGQVRAPQSVPYRTGLSIVEAIVQAGGMTSDAAEDRVVLTRSVDGEVLEFEVPVRRIMTGRAPNIPVQPGDTIFVPALRFLP